MGDMHVKAIMYLEAGIITETAEFMLKRENYLTFYIKQLGIRLKKRVNGGL